MQSDASRAFRRKTVSVPIFYRRYDLGALSSGCVLFFLLLVLYNIWLSRRLPVTFRSYWDKCPDFALLAAYPHLRELHICGCGKLQDLSFLSDLKELRLLNLQGCEAVRDLSPLASLLNLRRLRLVGCLGIPWEEIERFKKAHPQCDVEA